MLPLSPRRCGSAPCWKISTYPKPKSAASTGVTRVPTLTLASARLQKPQVSSALTNLDPTVNKIGPTGVVALARVRKVNGALKLSTFRLITLLYEPSARAINVVACDRDALASLNMVSCALCALSGRTRPEHLCRSKCIRCE